MSDVLTVLGVCAVALTLYAFLDEAAHQIVARRRAGRK